MHLFLFMQVSWVTNYSSGRSARLVMLMSLWVCILKSTKMVLVELCTPINSQIMENQLLLIIGCRREMQLILILMASLGP